TGPDAGVTVIEIQLAIEPRLHVIAHGHDSDRVPLPELRCLDLCRGELSTSPVVIVEPEIILEGVGADDVVLAVGESEHDPARGVLTSGDGLEFHRHVDVISSVTGSPSRTTIVPGDRWYVTTSHRPFASGGVFRYPSPAGSAACGNGSLSC